MSPSQKRAHIVAAAEQTGDPLLLWAVADGPRIIIVDAAPVGGPPGTLAVLRCGLGEQTAGLPAPVTVDGHAMTPQTVLQVLGTLGCQSLEVLLVGCQPAVLDEHMGLSETVRGAVPEAAELARSLAWEAAAGSPAGSAETEMESAGA